MTQVSRKRWRLAATVLSVTLVLAAVSCGSDDGDATPEVDVTKLDPGNYPTTPVDVGKDTDDQTGLLIEAGRIGAATPLVADIDSRYIHVAAGSYKVGAITGKYPAAVDGVDPEEFDAVAPGLVTGWRTQGQRRSAPNLGSSIALRVFRFGNAEQAAGAVTALSNRGSGQVATIPGYPEAKAKFDTTGYDPHLEAFLAKGDLVLNVLFEDPVSVPFEAGTPADLIKRTLDKMTDMLGQYQPTPVQEIATLAVDVDGLLSRTMPPQPGQAGSRAPRTGVFPVQTVLSYAEKPNSMRDSLLDAGVDRVALGGGAEVYRAEDAAAAARLFETQTLDDDPDSAPADPPPNLPRARCFQPVETPGRPAATSGTPQCYIVFDRYVAHVASNNVQDLHQKTAAQYELLAFER
ncbi:DUF7373 family lipoprotein [Nocardia callitridis]|uniref:ABC transporter substrate-binding protein n=1 Tax=Nocardia callitridis TaxID=648753 RepID=A0ABP9L0P5_9NOCA